MRFAPEFIEQVREANDLAEIVGQYTELKGRGGHLVGRCPFPDHPDKSPSFSVSEDKQLYHCYGCKKGGNIFTFLDTFNGMSFPEAVEYLARRANIALPEREAPSRAQNEARETKDTLLKMNKVAAVFYHQQMKALPKSDPVWAYAEKRGISDEIFEKFRLGFSSPEWQELYRHLLTRKAPLEAAEALKLILPKKGGKPGDSHVDRFRDRLMFPIFSSQGDVVGFGGRTLDPEGLPKYLNSSDSAVFDKSRVLYGLQETGKFIRAADYAVVVEGYMDAIALYAAGIKNVVAILGVAFTAEHAKILKRYTHNVTMLLDGDEAGLNGAERSLPILLEAGLTAKGLALPGGLDPDEFITEHGVARLQAEIGRARELFVLLLSKRWTEGYNGHESDKVKVMQEAAKVLARATNHSLQELYMLEVARQIDAQPTWVRNEMRTMIRALDPHKPGPAGGPSRPGSPAPLRAAAPAPPPEEPMPAVDEPVEKVILKGASRDEIFVLSLVLHYESLMKDLAAAETDDVLKVFTHPGVKELLELAVKKYQARPESFTELAAAMVDRVDDPAQLTVALGASEMGPNAASNAPEGIEKRLLADYYGSVRLRSLKARAKALTLQLRKSENTGESKQAKLEEFMAIQRELLEVERR